MQKLKDWIAITFMGVVVLIVLCILGYMFYANWQLAVTIIGSLAFGLLAGWSAFRLGDMSGRK